MNENSRYDFIIIGAGMAGLGAATKLAEAGKNVLVLEKEAYVGGRTNTVEVQGCKIDTGAQFYMDSYAKIPNLVNELNLSHEKTIATPVTATSRRGKLRFMNKNNPITPWTSSLLSFGEFWKTF